MFERCVTQEATRLRCVAEAKNSARLRCRVGARPQALRSKSSKLYKTVADLFRSWRRA